MNGRYRTLAALAAGVVVWSAPAVAAHDTAPKSKRESVQLVRRLIDERNTAGATEEARRAAEAYPESPHAQFSLAWALASAGDDPAAAAAAFQRADSAGSPTAVRLAARFNLGALAVRSAEALAESDPMGAIKELRRAERLFRSVLDLYPESERAGRNIDAVQRRIAELIRQVEAQQQQAGQDEQQQGADQGDQEQQPGDQSRQGDEDARGGARGDESESAQDQRGEPGGQDTRPSDSNASAQPGGGDQERSPSESDESAEPESPRPLTEEELTQLLDRIMRQIEEQGTRRADAAPPDAPPGERGAPERPPPDRPAGQSPGESADESDGDDESRVETTPPGEGRRIETPGATRPFDATAAEILDRERRIQEAIRRAFKEYRRRNPGVEKDW